MKANVKKLIAELDEKDKHYKLKLNILCKIITEPRMGHIIDDKIIMWAEEVGLKPRNHCEDRTSWWTCGI